MEYEEMVEWLSEIDNSTFVKVETIFTDEAPYYSVFLGTYMVLDPCGRFHHTLSPNGATEECDRFWTDLDLAAQQVGGWLESGEGDPCDIFFCLDEEEMEASKQLIARREATGA